MTATNITELKPNQIFVFGSNMKGRHAGGAARHAVESFGAVEGQGIGMQGQSYAVPTIDEYMIPLPIWAIQKYLKKLRKYAIENPDKEFLLTPVGTGIAGHSLSDIKKTLPKFPANVMLVGEWEDTK